MKKKFVVLMITAMSTAFVLAGCTNETPATPAVEPTEEAEVASEVVEEEPVEEEPVEEEPVEEETTEEEVVDDEANLEAVQASLTYMGGLFVNDSEECDTELAIFKNEDGGLVYLVYEADNIYYGLDPECVDLELEDGTAVTAFTLDDADFGYAFNEDMTEGVLVDSNGDIHTASELSEEEARAMVAVTLVGVSEDEAEAESDAEVTDEEAPAENTDAENTDADADAENKETAK